MLNIEITTTQNVTIQHELATVTDRFLAAFIDVIVITLFAFVFTYFIESAETDAGAWTIFVLFGVPFIWFYTLTSEAVFNGQTIGKKLLRIKVIKIDGKPLSFVDHFARWSSRLIDIWGSATSLGLIMMISSEQRQRLGGIISGTVVVRQIPRQRFSLTKIKKLGDYNEDDIAFPEAAQMTESQMLSLKRLLERNSRYNEKVYRDLLAKCSQTIKEDLKIEDSQKPDKFIRQIIKDYIVLTR